MMLMIIQLLIQKKSCLGQYGKHVALAHNEVFLAVEFHFGAAIFAIEHAIAHFEYHFFVFRTSTYGKHFALQGFFCVLLSPISAINAELLSKYKNLGLS